MRRPRESGDPYAAAPRFGTMANGFCSNKRWWLWVPAFAGTTKTRSPHPEPGLAEQRLLGRGLRAPVLRRGVDLAAELGGGVPAPARVVMHGARQRDHVGLAGGDDVLGLLRFGDQPDRDG